MKLIPAASGASTRDLMAVISDLLKNMILSSSPPVCRRVSILQRPKLKWESLQQVFTMTKDCL